MIALVLATLLAAPLGDPQLEAAIAEARQKPAIADRIEQISRLFLGTPYGQYPLGEGSGVEPQPRWRADMVDCQTYVETVRAMANAKDLAQAKVLLTDIRCKAPPMSFSARKSLHRGAVGAGQRGEGYLVEETTGIARAAPAATLVLRREQWSKVKGLERLAPAEIPEGRFPTRYLPLAVARRRAARIARTSAPSSIGSRRIGFGRSSAWRCCTRSTPEAGRTP